MALYNAPVRYSKADYIETESGNKVSRRSIISGSQNIVLGGKSVMQPSVVIRGDLKRAGGGQSVVIAVGKYCLFAEGCVIRPPYKTYKGVFSYYPIKIGDNVAVGKDSIVEAASIGNGVEIGKDCIIGRLATIKDHVKIHDGSVVPAGAVLPSLTEWAGSPARPIGALPAVFGEQSEARARGFYGKFQPE